MSQLCIIRVKSLLGLIFNLLRWYFRAVIMGKVSRRTNKRRQGRKTIPAQNRHRQHSSMFYYNRYRIYF